MLLVLIQHHQQHLLLSPWQGEGQFSLQEQPGVTLGIDKRAAWNSSVLAAQEPQAGSGCGWCSGRRREGWQEGMARFGVSLIR